MPIARNLKHYLDTHGVKYDVITHAATGSSMKTAEAAHIPGDRVAKTVVLKDDAGYLMAVLPATHHLDVERLNKALKRKLEMVSERELAKLFEDCEVGAAPPVPEAYHVQAALDEVLTNEPEIYFEAGDHRELIHVSGEQFQALQGKAHRGHFSYHV